VDTLGMLSENPSEKREVVRCAVFVRTAVRTPVSQGAVHETLLPRLVELALRAEPPHPSRVMVRLVDNAGGNEIVDGKRGRRGCLRTPLFIGIKKVRARISILKLLKLQNG
jgi:hypothetical protein